MGEMLLNGRLYGANGVMEITQAQYDALPVSKLTDGILYCIKDTGIVEGDKYAPIIYSLEEREVGVWTDGKPLYEKTINISSMSYGSTWNNYLHNIANIDKVVTIKATIINSTDGESYSVNAYRPVMQKGILVCCTKTEIQYLNDWYNANGVMLSVTVQYTKTTDVPGSGTWGTDGVPMVHYDGTERIIGTWFGETLYQKSYFIPNPVYLTTTTSSGTPSFTPTTVQDATMASIDKVVSITGHWTRHSDYGSGTVYDLVYPINAWETTNIFRSLVRVNTTAPSQAEIGWNYCIYTDNNISVAKNLFVTVQYTKTT